MELPDELLILILVLLPVKSLLRFKCVCKHWLSIIQSPHFLEYHCRLSETRRSNKLLCYRKDPITETYVISIVDCHTLEKLEDLEWPPFLEEVLEEECFDEDLEWPPFEVEEGYNGPTSFLRRIKIFGPVNGIYCIFRSLIDKWVGTLTLWNPGTREYKHIHPQISFPSPVNLLGFNGYAFMQIHQQEPQSLNIGFGFDHTTNDYKVVVICQWHDVDTEWHDVDAGIPRWHLRVYDHASDTWRTVYFLNCFNNPHPLFEGSIPPFPLMECDPPISHCLLNGVFHWACYLHRDDGCYFVLAFDMSTDVLRLTKGPPLPTHLGWSVWSVWVLKDTIAAVSYVLGTSDDPVDNVEVWMMMEYGVENSWALLFKLQGVENPIGIPYNDRIFFDNWNGQLLSSGIDEDHQVQEHDVYGMIYSTYHGIRGTLGILDYVETLATLKSL